MTISKYHHLVPKVYLNPWCYKNDSVYVLDKKSKNITSKNINNHYGKDKFHSLQAGMPNLMENDMKEIFGYLDKYDVYFDAEKLQDYNSYNDNYYEFHKWKIEREGKEISEKEKNRLKSSIEDKKIIDIEKAWDSKYENRWSKIRYDLLYKVLNSPKSSMDAINKGFLMKFIVGMNWRGFSGNENFTEAFNSISKSFGLDKICIPYEERNKKYLKTASEEMENYLLLKYYRDFLNDQGIIYMLSKQYIRFMTIKFYVASEKLEFVTSDNPSFLMKNIDGKKAHVMAITPKLLASVGLDEDKSNKYTIEYLNDQEVNEINNNIHEKAKADIIISENTKMEWTKAETTIVRHLTF